jgi:drug/metabolite transporter (DMT)-like permease
MYSGKIRAWETLKIKIGGNVKNSAKTYKKMQNIYIYSLVFLSGGLFLICDFLSANWGKTGNFQSLLIACFLAPLSHLLFGLLNQKVSMGLAVSLINLLIIISSVIVGKFYFHEVLNKNQLLGVFIACIAIILLGIRD